MIHRLITLINVFFLASEKCKDKDAEKCKDVDAQSCKTKGKDCMKSCHMCAEGICSCYGDDLSY